MFNKYTLILTSIAVLGFTGCTSSVDSLMSPTTQSTKKYVNYDNAPEYKAEAFRTKQQSVGRATQQDPKYKSFRPVLTNNETKSWFTNTMYLLWDRQITRSEYIAQGTAKFPQYKYEFTFIANQF